VEAEGPQRDRFFVAGGTLRADAPSYVARHADEELLTALTAGEFCYVLTSRQMGKSSLMVRTAARMREQGGRTAIVDLSALGRNLTPEQWYDGILVRIAQQLRLEPELEAYWAAQARLGPIQRFVQAMGQVVLAHWSGPVVILIDEIDMVRSLPFATDEFFAAIRSFYNERASEPTYGRLTFCLLGVARPTDLIRDPRQTPFSVGRSIELSDFTAEEAQPLVIGFGEGRDAAERVLTRVLEWTSGHPYLTQRLCSGIVQSGERVHESVVDEVCGRLFLSRVAREQDDNLVFVREWMVRSPVPAREVLHLYHRIWLKRPVRDAPGDPPADTLRLSGVVRSSHGRLHVRNRIYERVFSGDWVVSTDPGADAREMPVGDGAATAMWPGTLPESGVMGDMPSLGDTRARLTPVASSGGAQDDAASTRLEDRQDLFASSAPVGLPALDGGPASPPPDRPIGRVERHGARVPVDSDLMLSSIDDAPQPAPAGDAVQTAVRGRLCIVAILSAPGPGEESFWYPAGLAVDDHGAVYIADMGRHRIVRIVHSGTFATYSGPVRRNEPPMQPFDVAVDRHRNMYALDTASHHIVKLDGAGGCHGVLGGLGPGGGSMQQPQGITIDYIERLVVADTGNHLVQMFDSAGRFLKQFSFAEVGGLASPTGVWAGPEGGFMVCDTGHARLIIADRAGTVSALSTGSDDAPLRAPISACRDTSGNTWVVDAGYSALLRYSREGAFAGAVGPDLGAYGTFRDLRAVIATPDGDVRVSDAGNNRVVRIGFREGPVSA